MLGSDHHHFYFLICVHTCVFCSRTFATFRAVLEFAACHGCIEFSAKRGTKLLQKRREKIVSSLRPACLVSCWHLKEKGTIFLCYFSIKRWEMVGAKCKNCHFRHSPCHLKRLSNVYSTFRSILHLSLLPTAGEIMAWGSGSAFAVWQSFIPQEYWPLA